jgi:hypothetical protein
MYWMFDKSEKMSSRKLQISLSQGLKSMAGGHLSTGAIEVFIVA